MLSCMVDGERHAVPEGVAERLDDIVASLNGQLAKYGRFISSLRVNGEEIDAGLGQCAAWNRTDMNRIEVTTMSMAEMALNVLVEGGDYLVELCRLLSQTVDSYRAGDNRAGGELFMELVQGLEWFVKMTAAIEKLLRVDFAATRFEGRTLVETVDSLNRILLEIIVAQEERDRVLLGDLLEYELAPQLELWQEIFAMLRRQGAEACTDSVC